MTDHLSPTTLNALVDGELSAGQLAAVKEHLDGCSACTSSALAHSLLKNATAKSGQRYHAPPELTERMKRLVSGQQAVDHRHPVASGVGRRAALSGWATAAVILVLVGGWLFLGRHALRSNTASTENAALMTEVCDLHIATLAASMPPQVVSSDRHTVKPWFQGKLPFSFNLPENLPEDTKLEGANLTYVHDRPVAQLLYSVGRHRVSVFVQEKTGESGTNDFLTHQAGFQIAGFSTRELEVVAVSDVDPARLSGLMDMIRRVQVS
jgi:anti-sigma factor RsiW